MVNDKKLPPIPAIIGDTGEIQWDELNKLKHLNDNHIKNIVLKLMGFGQTHYDAQPGEAQTWIAIFRDEWNRRHPSVDFNGEIK